MPFVRISLRKGKNHEFKKNVSMSVHHALTDAFSIPEDDLFQVIGEFDEDNIVYPYSYMGIQHTGDIIFIQITAKKGRTAAMKKSLYKKVVSNIFESTQHRQSDVFITIIENTEENWSFGNGEAQLIS